MYLAQKAFVIIEFTNRRPGLPPVPWLAFIPWFSSSQCLPRALPLEFVLSIPNIPAARVYIKKSDMLHEKSLTAKDRGAMSRLTLARGNRLCVEIPNFPSFCRIGTPDGNQHSCWIFMIGVLLFLRLLDYRIILF